jgi:hypothetical protein
MKVSNAVYENCHLALDSPQDNEVVNAMLLHVTPGITFQDCLITYSGGTINLILSCKDRAANIDVGNPVTAHSQVIINTPPQSLSRTVFFAGIWQALRRMRDENSRKLS